MAAATLLAVLVLYLGVSHRVLSGRRMVAPAPLVTPSAVHDSLADEASRRPRPGLAAIAPQLVTTRATAIPLSADAIVYASDDRGDVVGMRLERGTARFEVRHVPDQPFRVDAGPVLVEVLGTEFTIARYAHQATVSVISGVVRAHWPGGQSTLRTGQTATFPPSAVPSSMPGPLPPAAATQPPKDEPPSVRTGDATQEDVDSLLDAADQARLEGRTDDAITLIQRVLAQPLDPEREVAAAFALAHAHNSRGEFELAATAFARAREAAPDGALAEDALAREVQAWAQANNPARAKEAALRYRARYPNGRRSKMVSQFGTDD